MPYSARSPYTPQQPIGSHSRNIMELMQRSGDIEAQRSANSGAIWGNALQQLGGIAGQAIEQHNETKRLKAEQAQDAERSGKFAALVQHLGEMPPEAFVAETIDIFQDPERGQTVAQGALSLQKSALDLQMSQQALEAGEQERADALRKSAMEGLTSYQIPAIRALGVEHPLSQQALGEIAQIWSPYAGMQLTPEILTENFDALAEQLAPVEKPAPIKLGERERLVSPEGTEIVGAAPMDPLEAEKARLTNEKLKAEIGRLRASPEKPAPTLTEVDKIAQRWKTATADTREIKRQVSLMEEGLKAAERGDLAAGSQAVLVTFQKILDPTSVVRESEYARSAAGQSALSRAEGVFDKLAQGGAGVPVSELKKFAELAREMAKVGSAEYLRAEKERLGKVADDYNIRRDMIFEDVDYSGGNDPLGLNE